MNYQQTIYELEKRFKTTMIGSLARFEQSFGHLWEEDGPDQQEYLDIWEYTRNSILNNGNKQMRAAIDEVSNMFGVGKTSTRYTYNFKQDQGDQK